MITNTTRWGHTYTDEQLNNMTKAVAHNEKARKEFDDLLTISNGKLAVVDLIHLCFEAYCKEV